MADLLDVNNLGIFLILIFPGFISYKIWTLINPSLNLKISEIIYEIACYSISNLIFLLYFVIQLSKPEICDILFYLYWIIILFLGPILWPILLSKILNNKHIKKHILNITPNSWDYFFKMRNPCFILIHLKNEKLIGGLYAGKSFASSYPQPKDIYLREVWKIDPSGKFLNKINNSKGLYISYDQIAYVEFFEAIANKEK